MPLRPLKPSKQKKREQQRLLKEQQWQLNKQPNPLQVQLIQKPKQEWLKNDATVKKLKEEIEQEQAEARVKNKARIEALEKHRAQLDKDIQRLSNTFRSESLINALQEYIEDTLPQLDERVGLRLHKAMKPEDLPPEQVIELYTEDVQFGIKYPVFRVPDEDVSLV